MAESFHAFIHALSQHTDQPPLNRVALGYWQDYQTGQAIDGGVAYESVLRKLPLDGSLHSLQRLDKFLQKVQPHLVNNFALLNQKTDQRNLLTFIAFYTGLVLVYHANQSEFINRQGLIPSMQWISYEQLCQTYPPLQRVITPDFSYSLAVSLLPISGAEQVFVPAVISDSVCFPLVSIIETLYPQRQNPLIATAPNFGYISPRLFDSVTQLLKRWQNLTFESPLLPPTRANHSQIFDNDGKANLTAITPLPTNQASTPVAHSLLSDLDNPLMERKDWQAVAQSVTRQQPIVTYFDFVVPDFSNLSMDEAEEQTSKKNLELQNEADNTATTLSIKAIDTAQPSAISNDKTRPEKTHQKLDTHSLSGRQAIKAAKQQAKELARQKAERDAKLAKEAEAKRQAEIAEALANPRINEKLLNQRKSMVDDKPTSQDSFSELESDLQTIHLPDNLADNIHAIYQQSMTVLSQPSATPQHQQALAVVQKLAQANVSDAMLHQALWLLRGRADLGIAQDTNKGIGWIKKAAQLQDNRAEKLLSKLYFSGEIVGLDTELGKFWLAKAAAHGHVEAKRLQQSFALVSTLKETRHEEDDYLKKLAIGTAILVGFMLIVIFALKV